MIYVIAADLKTGRALVCLKAVNASQALPPSEMYYSMDVTPTGYIWNELQYDEAFHMASHLPPVHTRTMQSAYMDPHDLAVTMRNLGA